MATVAGIDRASDWDPRSEEARDHPERVLARLRNECPVAYSDAFGGFWALSRYDDIDRAAKDSSTFSIERQFIIPPIETGGVRWKPQQSDPPEHGKYRAVLQPFFARGRVRALEPGVRRLAVELIERFEGTAEVDLCSSFTRPFTGRVLCMFLGFPEGDWDLLYHWTEDQLAAAARGDMEQVRRVMAEMSQYINDLRLARTERPLPPTRDLMSAVLAARIDGQSLSAPDIDGMFKQLMGAGHETTGSELGNLLRHLVEHPDDQARLRSEPQLIGAAVEETIRMWGAIFGLVRTTTCPVTVSGEVIPADSVVALLWSSAGRDASVNDHPDDWDLARTNARHLSFGAGPHRCIGADLARLELRVATEEILSRTKAVRLNGVPRRQGWPAVGTSALPVVVDWANDPPPPQWQ